ncbi:MAG TPA: hypothetical protein VEV84_04185, partial [Pyrinomonadaceae bacterium]|nr:hypothetical protein [Pyrinomonadaceae bacterium]
MHKPLEALPILQAAHNALQDDPDILVDAGDAARFVGDLSLAANLYSESRKRGADGFQISFGEAMICQDRKLWLEAIRLWTELNQVYPNNAFVLHNLGKAWHELGETDKAVSLMLESFELGHDNSTLAMLALLAPHAGSCRHEDILRLRTEFGKQLKSQEGDPRDGNFRRKENGQINIGYISAFFHRPNWMKPVWALLNNHDRKNFNIHLFADGPADEIKAQGGYIPHEQDTIYDVRKLGNRELAKLINDRGIDVLVDLNGYSAIPRLGLLTAKPAPVTVAWFNQYATSGLP